jgi:hypothetical protein
MVSNRHRRTYEALLKSPVRADIAWRDVEALLKALGAEVTEGNGSRVRVHLNGISAVFHRPHPRKEIVRGAVRSVREFLEKAGVKL